MKEKDTLNALLVDIHSMSAEMLKLLKESEDKLPIDDDVSNIMTMNRERLSQLQHRYFTLINEVVSFEKEHIAYHGLQILFNQIEAIAGLVWSRREDIEF